MVTLLDNYAFAEHEVCASLCEDSYFEFFREFAPIVIDEDIVYNWHVKYLCEQIQELMEYVIAWKPYPYDLIVNLPPGMTKSTIFSVCLCPWMWTRMPRFRYISVTHTDMLGKELSMASRDIVLNEKYKACWPHLSLREDQNTKDKWDNNHGGWRMSVTVGGRTPTGFHAHTIGIDDAIDPEQIASAAKIKKASDYCRRTLPSRKVDKKRCPTLMVMQRLDIDDPVGDRERNENAGPIKKIVLPCDDTWEIRPKFLRQRYKRNKGLLDPKRLPLSVLKKEHARMGNFSYAGQYGQSPLPKGGIIFDTTQLTNRISSNVPQPHDFKRMIRYWDKAYSQDSGAYTVGVKMGLTKTNQFWVLDVVRMQKEAHGREADMRAVAIRDTKNVKIWIEQEPAAGKESVQASIRNLRGFVVQADRRGGVNDANKVRRADPFATQVNAGNVWLKAANWNEDYIQELMYFSERAKYKDQVDASSGAFNVLNRVTHIGAL